MTENLREQAGRLRVAVSVGDFAAAREALRAYAKDLQSAVESAKDPAALARLERDWAELVLWTRCMTATARELARSAWAQIPPSIPYRLASNPHRSIISTRG